MRKLSESEAQNASDESLLLPSKGVPTRLLSLYLQRAGKKYYQRRICSLHQRIANAKPNTHQPSLH